MRLAIIEDSHSLLENLKLMLGGEENITVVGAFRSAEDALKKLKRIAPEIILVDVDLPGMSGTEFIKRSRTVIPKLQVLVHSMADDRKTVSSAFNAGAMGYILKGSKPRELVEAILALYEGGAPMSPRIARMMITGFHHKINGEENVLSRHEKEINL